MNEPPRESLGVLLREFAAFIRRPRPTASIGLHGRDGWRRLAIMTALMIVVLLGLILPLLQAWQAAFALPTPDAYGKLPPAMLVTVVLLIAPVSEELLFRGWLSGKPRALWLLACALVSGALLYGSVLGFNPLVIGAGLLGLLVATPLGWFLLRKRHAPGWFAAAFPAMFYLTTAIFSLSHISNYPAFSVLALPLIVPQLWAGLVLGFVRMRIGLPASILAHMASNAAALVVAQLAG
ncbi:MAG TPA: CPBP family glutamic-type intramembrane protease [Croceibacterium sp.]|nr:CPBP family glutamic-type intramembrane protease [Croceibacterium sp.]